jgi:hypothetical protein
MWEGPDHRITEGHEGEGTREANGEEELVWLTLAKEAYSIASPVVKKVITPRTAPNDKEREEQELRLISSILTQKKTQCTKEAKQEAAE